MADPYQRLSHREIYRNPWLAVEHHEIIHPTGVHGEHVLIVGQRPSGVLVLDNADEFYFALQPRFAARTSMLEICKGGADEGESPLAAAQRELQEELGLAADRWDALGGVFELPSLMERRIELFLARDVHTVASHPEQTEAILLQRMSRHSAVAAALYGEITDAVTCVAILRADALISR